MERIGDTRSWMMVSAGVHHTCALTTDSLAFCWGANDAMQLGSGDNNDHVRPNAVGGAHHFARISAHVWHSCALDAGGHAWCEPASFMASTKQSSAGNAVAIALERSQVNVAIPHWRGRKLPRNATRLMGPWLR